MGLGAVTLVLCSPGTQELVLADSTKLPLTFCCKISAFMSPKLLYLWSTWIFKIKDKDVPTAFLLLNFFMVPKPSHVFSTLVETEKHCFSFIYPRPLAAWNSVQWISPILFSCRIEISNIVWLIGSKSDVLVYWNLCLYTGKKKKAFKCLPACKITCQCNLCICILLRYGRCTRNLPRNLWFLGCLTFCPSLSMDM